MIRIALIAVLTAAAGLVLFGQQAPFTVAQSSSPKIPADDPSGMFTFLRDGEFVQLLLEDGKLTGLISRFGESDSDKGQFIDQFFSKASLDGEHLRFATKTVHGIWYEFDGILSVAPGKQTGQEGYRIIKGTLTRHAEDAKGTDKASQRQVEFKSFPGNMGR